MPLNLDSMHCAVRVIGDVKDARSGQWERRAVGTGFFVTVASEMLPNVRRQPYLLTAHHVIAGQDDIEIQVPHPATGKLTEPVSVRDWSQPLEGVDLAVATLDGRLFPARLSIPLEDLVLKDQSGALFPGSIVYYVGLLAPDDRVMARSGTVGALDQTGLKFQQGYSYTAHLVDCRSYGGFSGSPCFVDLAYAELEPTEPPSPPPDGTGDLGELHHLTMLCGMFTSHRTDENEDGTVSRYGVGVMLRSEEIREALMTEPLRKQRAAEDERFKEATADPGYEPAGTETGDDEFARFEELTRKLTQVPKKELDEKRGDEARPHT